MNKKICIRYCVAGRVQGVWFRAHTQKQANKLGLTGWARNLPDGRVEVLACGEKAQLDQLHQWLLKGPVLAKVEDVTYEKVPWTELTSFEVIR